MSYPRLRAYVFLFVSPQQDAEDVIQETALAAARDYGRYDPSRPFLEWVIGIARNRIRQYYSSTERNRKMIFDAAAIASLESAYEAASSEFEDVRDSLDYCIGRLPAKSRRIIESRYLLSMGPVEIARRLQMTTQSVYTRLSQIRNALRQCIERRLRLAENKG